MVLQKALTPPAAYITPHPASLSVHSHSVGCHTTQLAEGKTSHDICMGVTLEEGKTRASGLPKVHLATVAKLATVG